MKNEKAIKDLLEQCNGLVTSSQVTKAGIPRCYLSKMVLEKKLVRAARGVYATPETWEDELFILQYRYSRGIFSHETALDIHGLTDRMSTRYVMTFPAGYNTSALKDTVVNAKTCVKKLYDLGIVEKSTACDNIVKVYDVERTLCDIVRGNKSFDIQLVNQAMKAYVRSGTKNIQKLMRYAESLQVKSKIQMYMEMLL
jgi:predicted transcriptional regulator of viral defense system